LKNRHYSPSNKINQIYRDEGDAGDKGKIKRFVDSKYSTNALTYEPFAKRLSSPNAFIGDPAFSTI
jgi:hypothetical protein